MTERSQERPPRKNSRPQNSRKRAVASAPTTSPPPPTPMTSAREEERIRSSSESGGKFMSLRLYLFAELSSTADELFRSDGRAALFVYGSVPKTAAKLTTSRVWCYSP